MTGGIKVIVEPIVINVTITGATGRDGIVGKDGVVQNIVAGSNISVDNTDPANPIITNTAAGVTVHNDLTGRNTSDAHPISSITDLSTTLSNKASSSDVSTAITTCETYTDTRTPFYWRTVTTVTLSNTSAPIFFTGLTSGKRYRLRFVDISLTGDGSNPLYYRLRNGGSTGTIVSAMYSGYNMTSQAAAISMFKSTNTNSIGFFGGQTFVNAFLPANGNQLFIGIGSTFNKCNIEIEHNGYKYTTTPLAHSVVHKSHIVPLSSVFDTLEIYCATTATFVSGSIVLESMET